MACSRTLRVCCAVTPGNHSRNSCTVAPPSIFSNNAATGTRVPRNTHAPLTRSASRSTAVQVVQSIILQSYALNRNGSMSAAKRLPNSRCRNQRCWSRWAVDRPIYFPPQLVNGLSPVYLTDFVLTRIHGRLREEGTCRVIYRCRSFDLQSARLHKFAYQSSDAENRS